MDSQAPLLDGVSRRRKKAPAAAAPASLPTTSAQQNAVAEVQAQAGAPNASSPSLEPMEGEVWYLAFGSNMSPKVLTGRRNVKPMSSLTCTVPGYTLGFHYKGIPYLEPGFATIVPLTAEAQEKHMQELADKQAQALDKKDADNGSMSGMKDKSLEAQTEGKPPVVRLRASTQGPSKQASGTDAAQDSRKRQGHSQEPSAKPSALKHTLHIVASMLTFVAARDQSGPASQGTSSGIYGQPLHGVLHLIKREEWEAVQQSEGVGNPKSGYQVVQVKCRLYDGEWVTAETLMAAPSNLGDPHAVLPSRRYVRILQEGARHHCLDPAYCDMLDAQPSYDHSPRGKRVGSWIMSGLLLSCTVWLVPLLMLLATLSRVRNIIMLFVKQRVVPYVKVRHPRTAALTKQITNPVSVRFIHVVSTLTHALHDW
eukprot:CAMPEP_0202422156 /NCGR_PEP_ID=MMETSP1128-20130828/50709_1 /ASSEMBLY_ACC=CAM_ASM_000463 /TAXON_ID=3047 /ORGANISM="Dunaliella tertiolecta, Strain CCMP1320" /LENGTH=424 /DNA_ID=CAMNT_0049030203 /DNA_START=643 /DNA_END=1914 /DNA_ORIENTATION=+